MSWKVPFTVYRAGRKEIVFSAHISGIHEVKEQAPASPVLMKRSLRRILGYRWLDSISSGPPCVHVTSLSPPEYQSQVCAKHTPFGELLCPLRPPPIYGLHGGSSGTRMGALDQESSKVKAMTMLMSMAKTMLLLMSVAKMVTLTVPMALDMLMFMAKAKAVSRAFAATGSTASQPVGFTAQEHCCVIRRMDDSAALVQTPAPAGTTTYPLSVFTGISHSVKAQHVTVLSVPVDVLQDVTCDIQHIGAVAVKGEE
ncbi:hypothetical protein Celaphus_00012583, partial [Cervus elaphus hippelaphus]